MAKKTEGPGTTGKRNGDGKPAAEAAPATGQSAPQVTRRPAQRARPIYQGSVLREPGCAGGAARPRARIRSCKVTVNVNATSKSDDNYEVVLNIEVHAKGDTGIIYNVELFYAGMFRLRGVPQNMLQPVLFIDCPAILFPFVRRVLADVTRDGGFPPLMLDPIDFGRLYSQNLARAGEGQAAN